jgi:hypothetical protein
MCQSLKVGKNLSRLLHNQSHAENFLEYFMRLAANCRHLRRFLPKYDSRCGRRDALTNECAIASYNRNRIIRAERSSDRWRSLRPEPLEEDEDIPSLGRRAPEQTPPMLPRQVGGLLARPAAYQPQRGNQPRKCKLIFFPLSPCLFIFVTFDLHTQRVGTPAETPGTCTVFSALSNKIPIVYIPVV